ncbi:MAG: HAMP domain-containing protein, partial [Afipia sp.]|nr:HAMP domain-containing protein [Afipia sp.]
IIVLGYTAYNTVVRTKAFGEQYESLAAYDLALVSALDEIKFYGARVISSTNELILDYTIERESLGDAEAITNSDELAQIEDSRERMWDALGRYESLIALDPNADNVIENAELAATIGVSSQSLVNNSSIVVTLNETEFDIGKILEVRASSEESEAVFLDAVNRALDHELQDLNARRELTNTLIDEALRKGAILAVGTLLLILGIAHLMYTSISRPLIKLKLAASEFRRGNLEVRTGIHSEDEFGQVARTLDEMAKALETSINELESQTIQAVEAREQAERSDLVKSQFLASMSHELRTPLNAVLNFTQFVSSGLMGDVNERQVDALTKVYNSGAHLLDLINDVLDISKIEADSLQLFVEENISLSKEMSVVVDSAETALKGKPVRLRVEIPEDIPLMTGDRQRIRQIILNMVNNACKFTDEGDVTLKLSHVGDDILFTIRDTGPGIAPEEQEVLYDPFQQGHAGLRHGGTGLGLPISKRLIDAHGGSIRFETEVGKGTTFYVSLPVCSPILKPIFTTEKEF